MSLRWGTMLPPEWEPIGNESERTLSPAEAPQTEREIAEFTRDEEGGAQ